MCKSRELEKKFRNVMLGIDLEPPKEVTSLMRSDDAKKPKGRSPFAGFFRHGEKPKPPEPRE